MSRVWSYAIAVVIIGLFALVLMRTWYNKTWWIRRAVAKWNGEIEPLDDGESVVSIKRASWRMKYLLQRPLRSLRTLHDLGALPDEPDA